jgi:hypothetical protein
MSRKERAEKAAVLGKVSQEVFSFLEGLTPDDRRVVLEDALRSNSEAVAKTLVKDAEAFFDQRRKEMAEQGFVCSHTHAGKGSHEGDLFVKTMVIKGSLTLCYEIVRSGLGFKERVVSDYSRFAYDSLQECLDATKAVLEEKIRYMTSVLSQIP